MNLRQVPFGGTAQRARRRQIPLRAKQANDATKIGWIEVEVVQLFVRNALPTATGCLAKPIAGVRTTSRSPLLEAKIVDHAHRTGLANFHLDRLGFMPAPLGENEAFAKDRVFRYDRRELRWDVDEHCPIPTRDGVANAKSE